MQWAESHGLWSLLTFLLALGGLSVWALLYRRRAEGISLYATHRFETGHGLYPNVVYLAVRNTLDSPVVVSRPNFRFSGGLKAGRNAHGNLATGDYELKFRKIDRNQRIVPGDSYTTILLRHRESAMAYMPIDDLNEQSFAEMLDRNRLWGGPKAVGWVYFDLIVLGPRGPKVVRMKQPLHKVEKDCWNLELGRDPTKSGPSASAFGARDT